jgi:arginyl-tRNA synthetase
MPVLPLNNSNKSFLPHILLQERLCKAVLSVLPDVEASTVKVRPCADLKHGDYACSALIAIAKQRKLNPMELARKVGQEYSRIVNSETSNLEIGITMEFVPPGFFNFRLSSFAIQEQLKRAARGEHLFFAKAAQPRTMVVDFSSPNVAKPMHVGHIRSTGIGDALQRTLRLLGHKVVTDNHIGDWGTQFGMLILAWKAMEFYGESPSKAADRIAVLEDMYKKMALACKGDPESLKYFADRLRQKFGNEFLVTTSDKESNYALEKSRLELVKLQAGDAENMGIWKEMIRLSQIQFDTIYSRLGIKFDQALGESFYNPWLGEVVNDLLARGIARESEGAVAVFSDGTLPQKEDPFLVKDKEGEWVPDPALVRKSDGGFNYTTTDLATIQYRLKTWLPDEIVYVVDDRQGPHFKKLFLIFARW